MRIIPPLLTLVASGFEITTLFKSGLSFLNAMLILISCGLFILILIIFGHELSAEIIVDKSKCINAELKSLSAVKRNARLTSIKIDIVQSPAQANQVFQTAVGGWYLGWLKIQWRVF